MRRRRRRWDALEDELGETTQTVDPQREPLTDRLMSEARGDAASIAAHLAAADDQTKTRALHGLQRDHGNAFVQSVMRSLAVGKGSHAGGGTGVGFGRGDTITLERDEEEPEPADATDEVEQLADIPEGATEEIGPTTSSSYAVAATSLSDIASQLASRDEAGYCGWKEAWNFKTGPTGRITAVKVTVKIDIEMPAWTPPPSMLPKTKAEWERSYQALLAHERGHEKLVHDYFDGLANKILGKTARQGRQQFDGAKSGLAAASRRMTRRPVTGRRPARSSTPRSSSESSTKRRRKTRRSARRRPPRKLAGRPKAMPKVANRPIPPPSRDRSQVAESSSK